MYLACKTLYVIQQNSKGKEIKKNCNLYKDLLVPKFKVIDKEKKQALLYSKSGSATH